MDEIYSLYIGYAPDCSSSSTTAAATICPHGTGKSRREQRGIVSTRGGLVRL